MSFWGGFARGMESGIARRERADERAYTRAWQEKMFEYRKAQDEYTMERNALADELAREKFDLSKKKYNLDVASTLGLDLSGTSTSSGGKKGTDSFKTSDVEQAMSVLVPLLKSASDKDSAADALVMLQSDPRNAIKLASSIQFAQGVKGDRTSSITGNDIINLVKFTKPEDFDSELESWKGNVSAFEDFKKGFDISTATESEIIQYANLQKLASKGQMPRISMNVDPSLYRETTLSVYENQAEAFNRMVQKHLGRAMAGLENSDDKFTELSEIKTEMDNKDPTRAYMMFGPQALDDLMIDGEFKGELSGLFDNPFLSAASEAWHDREERRDESVVRMSKEQYQNYLAESGVANSDWNYKPTEERYSHSDRITFPETDGNTVDITGKTEEEVRSLALAKPDATFIYNGERVDLVNSTAPEVITDSPVAPRHREGKGSENYNRVSSFIESMQSSRPEGSGGQRADREKATGEAGMFTGMTPGEKFDQASSFFSRPNVETEAPEYIEYPPVDSPQEPVLNEELRQEVLDAMIREDNEKISALLQEYGEEEIIRLITDIDNQL